MQVFLEMTEQAKSWLASKEAFLNNDDVGVGLPLFIAIFMKHKGLDFEIFDSTFLGFLDGFAMNSVHSAAFE